MFGPPGLLALQVVPTAAILPAGQPGLLRPSRTCVVAFARIGYARRPTTGNWRHEDFHLARFTALSTAPSASSLSQSNLSPDFCSLLPPRNPDRVTAADGRPIRSPTRTRSASTVETRYYLASRNPLQYSHLSTHCISYLACQTVQFVLWTIRAHGIYPQGQLMGLIPNPQVSEVLHIWHLRFDR